MFDTKEPEIFGTVVAQIKEKLGARANDLRFGYENWKPFWFWPGDQMLVVRKGKDEEPIEKCSWKLVTGYNGIALAAKDIENALRERRL